MLGIYISKVRYTISYRLLVSVCIRTRWSLNFSVPCAPTSTPQGYTTLPPHPHPQMRTLPLVSVRGTFGWAHLWSTLLASFPVRGQPVFR